MPAYIPFVRVSTKRQDHARQLADLATYAKLNGWELAPPIIETTSRTKKNKERPALQHLLRTVRPGDKVLVTEVSRLGGRLSHVLLTRDELTERNVSVVISTMKLETLDEKGKETWVAKLIFTAFAQAAELEVELLRDRVQSGVDQAKANGVQLGRPKESLKTPEVLLKDHADVVKLLEKGRSVREIKKLTNTGSAAIMKVRYALGLAGPKDAVQEESSSGSSGSFSEAVITATA